MRKVYNRYYILLVVLLLFSSITTSATEKITLAYIDSVSEHHYLLGNWNEVILAGQLAKESGIDFKWLQQRVGYAYFNQRKYYKSMQHYENALTFDKEDAITHLYLYYNGINTGDIAYARCHAGRLSMDTKSYLQQKQFKPLDAIDVEFSYKVPEHEKINDAMYKRIGLNTLIGYQFNMYQTFSGFNQSTDSTQTTQNEYFALIGWNPAARTSLSLGYHYVRTKVLVDTVNYYYPGNIIYGKISQKFNRIDLSVSGAYFLNDWIDSKQIGLHAGIGFDGQHNIHLTSAFYRILETSFDNNYGRNVFKQTASVFPIKRIWTEASVSLGNLNHFIDNNGLYIYNALDPVTFRTGLSVYGFVSKAMTLYVNYTLDEKLIVSSNQNYQQHSITGGIIWKL